MYKNKERIKYRPPRLHKLIIVLCIDNQDYPMSLTVGKVYLAWSEGKLLRVIDETEEDYLYIAYDNFIEMASSKSEKTRSMKHLISNLKGETK